MTEKHYTTENMLAFDDDDYFNERPKRSFTYGGAPHKIPTSPRQYGQPIENNNNTYTSSSVGATSEILLASPEEKALYLSLHDLCAVNIDQINALDIPPRENILAPIIQTQSLNMIFAKRGVGKTHIALGLSYAIASGGMFLGWQAPKALRVLYLDGEMPAVTMKKRLQETIRLAGKKANPDYFMLINPDLNREIGMPDLSTPDGQYKIDKYVDNADVVVVDNISTLARTGSENEAESWLPLQNWALGLRAQGKSVIFIHHAGKSGAQRGTSKREDVLDTVIELRHPDDYKPEQGARFEVHLTKARNMMGGDDAKAFEAHLRDDGWHTSGITDPRLAAVLALHDQGKSLRKIEEETGIPRNTISNLLKRNE